MMDPDTARELKRIQRQLDKLLEVQTKAMWAKVAFVQSLTGWDAEKLRQAREQGLVEWKKDEKLGWLYNLNSIPKIFIRENNTTTRGGRLDGAGALAGGSTQES